MKRIIFFLGILFSNHISEAQVFGGTPPSVKWRQLNTDTARVIFPEGLDSTANQVANTIHQLAQKDFLPLGKKLKKINIVLQNQNVVTNGYVGLAPYRSEFYLTPPTTGFHLGSLPWSHLLSLHEYRHVQQFNNFENGISKTIKKIFGEEGYAVATGAAIPDWFFEGDAVYTETVLSSQGRGRLPRFFNDYHALWQSQKEYSWMKLRNGSLKDFAPTHYPLGYLLTRYGYEKYGNDFWKNVTQDASRYKGIFYSWQKAVKKYSGVSYKQFYTEAFNSYKEKLNETISTHNKNSFLSQTEQVSTKNKKYVTHYLYPYILGEDSLLYLKKTYRHRPAFVIKTGGTEQTIRIRDIAIDDYFSYKNGTIVYTAYENDARWGWKNYSVIKRLNIYSGKQTTLTHQSRYFTPDISDDGNLIIAVNNTTDTKSELHVLDAFSGEVKQVIRSSSVLQYATPKFIDPENIVAAVSYPDGTMALNRIQLSSKEMKPLTPAGFHIVGYPFVKKDTVFFTASYNGNDDVFMLNLSDQSIYRITNGITGNYFPNASNDKIIWSNFTAEGYQLQQIDISKALFQQEAVKTLEPVYPLTTNTISALEKEPTATQFFEATPYKKSTGLFNFHSWRPYYEDPLFYFTLYGENVLNTLQSELYYQYNENEKSNTVGFNTIYGGWLPYLSGGIDYTFDRQFKTDSLARNWSQLDTRVGVNIPLHMIRGKTNSGLNIGSNYYYRRQFNKGWYKDSVGNTGFSYLHHYINISQQAERALQHIYPKWGYQTLLQYRHAITDIKSWQFNSALNVYLPGIAANHSLVLSGAFQEIDTARVAFSDRFSYSRGYNNPYFSRAWRISGNYHFPIIHPDFGFANILYINRIRGNAFYDFTKVYSADKLQTRNQRSTGTEIYFDTKWWNQYELSFGLRFSYLLDTDFHTPKRNTYFELVMPVSIIPR